MPFRLSLSRQQSHHMRHKRWQSQVIGRAVSLLGHVDLSEDTNPGLVLLVAVHSAFYN